MLAKNSKDNGFLPSGSSTILKAICVLDGRQKLSKVINDCQAIKAEEDQFLLHYFSRLKISILLLAKPQIK